VIGNFGLELKFPLSEITSLLAKLCT